MRQNVESKIINGGDGRGEGAAFRWWLGVGNRLPSAAKAGWILASFTARLKLRPDTNLTTWLNARPFKMTSFFFDTSSFFFDTSSNRAATTGVADEQPPC
jgi:hypothetical protein